MSILKPATAQDEELRKDLEDSSSDDQRGKHIGSTREVKGTGIK